MKPILKKGKPPIVKYPDECAYDGACWMRCPQREKGANKVSPAPADEGLHPERRAAMKPDIEVIPIETDVLVIGGGLAWLHGRD